MASAAMCTLSLPFIFTVFSFVSSHWLTRVLLPSGHLPYGDGLTWDIFPVKRDLIPVWQILHGRPCSLHSTVFSLPNLLWLCNLVGLKDPCVVAPYNWRTGVMSTSNTSKTCCGIAPGWWSTFFSCETAVGHRWVVLLWVLLTNWSYLTVSYW